jgi:hypothetical protein
MVDEQLLLMEVIKVLHRFGKKKEERKGTVSHEQ